MMYENGDFAGSQVRMVARGDGVGRHQFDQVRNERQAIRMIGWLGGIARLTETTHVANGADRSPGYTSSPSSVSRNVGNMLVG